MRPPADTPIDASDVPRAQSIQAFQGLMPFRVREVLLVGSRYDTFMLKEEGQITDLFLQEYDRLNLRYAPRMNTAPSARDALELLGSNLRFDMVIVTMHPLEMDPADFAREVKRRFPHLPVVLLGYDNRELQELRASPDAAAFDRIFIWTGDARILLAIVSLIEDERNVENDTAAVGVQVILFIEDSVHFISAFLPMLYAELLKQSQRLISEGLTVVDKLLRMRARPKVLLVSTYEEAMAVYERYRQSLLGVISDVSFAAGGRPEVAAGVIFARRVHQDHPDAPILLQSTDARNAELARSVGSAFLHKASPNLRHELEEFMLDAYGFGPFVFRLRDGTEVGAAQNLAELRACLGTIPDESFLYHAERNHFSTWLKARGEFRLARSLRPRQLEHYTDLDDMRRSVIAELDASRRQAYRDTIAEFSPETFGTLSRFARAGGGSFGGKARGLAFLAMLLRESGLAARYPDIDVVVPPLVVIGTAMFDRFVEMNDFAELARRGTSDEAIRRAVLDARLPDDLMSMLRSLVGVMRIPIAVRSSSRLEDSQHQPFAGVYETYMLPNTDANNDARLHDLCAAIKLVYASTFSSSARMYLEATPQRPEKEKMAVIVQELIGRRHGDRFYPDIAGVAQSYNFYPVGRIQPDDGTSRVALGLGRRVVESGAGLRFCPRYPRHLPQLSSVDDILQNSQKTFEALRLTDGPDDPHERFQPVPFPVEAALEDGTIGPVGSIYSSENHAVYDGVARAGTPLVTFAGILKHRLFPLPEILDELLQIGTQAMGTPIEIEYAVDLEPNAEGRRTFACLQMRPITVMRDLSRVNLDRIDRANLLCQSPRALGHGRITGIRDVVCVHPEEFDRKESAITAAAVATLNAKLRKSGRQYLLIGPGRWGSADPWLGIPVSWGQIASARIIIETGFRGLYVTPSEGSHFFHNMTAFHVAYMTTNPERGEGLIDWTWLLEQQVVERGANGLRWIRLAEPVLALIDGRSGTGVIAKSADHVVLE
jgi:CheY-like chemotaxis protein